MTTLEKSSIANKLVSAAFLVLLNLALMTIIGYLTLNVDATVNSRVAALLLSFFMPFFIVYKTPYMSGLERFLKFGSGFLVYITLSLIIIRLPAALFTWLLPCLVLALAVLYYGKELLHSLK